MIAYPIVCLILFNIGIGLILSAMFVFSGIRNICTISPPSC